MTALRLSRFVRFKPCEALAPTAKKIASRRLPSRASAAIRWSVFLRRGIFVYVTGGKFGFPPVQPGLDLTG
jgi:hypothetical protein